MLKRTNFLSCLFKFYLCHFPPKSPNVLCAFLISTYLYGITTQEIKQKEKWAT